MTATLAPTPRPLPAAPAAPAASSGDPRTRARRLRRADGLVVAAWASAAVAVALYLATGLLDLATPGALFTSAGIVAGLVASDLVLVMLVLAARIPAIDRTVGHDRAMAAHTRLGKPAFLLLLAHAALLTLGYALTDGTDVISETATLLGVADMPLAYAALGLFALVVVSSLVVARRRLPYEAWHVVHLLSYAAVLGGLPHQLSQGAVLAEGTLQRVYWIALYVAALGSIVVFRMLRPLIASLRHGIRVESVERIAPDAFSIHLRGRDVDRLGARGGQFFFWRFWSAATWWHTHPVSLSAEPGRDRLRITIREAGAGTRRLAALRPGTRVSLSGPFGLFTETVRARPHVAIVAAGIGVTPVRALVERLAVAPGEATLLVRASDESELYLWDEVEAWAAAKGIALYSSLGPRAHGPDGWLSAADVARGVTAGSVFPRLGASDVYICGPDGWSRIVEQRMRSLGVAEADLHREGFSW